MNVSEMTHDEIRDAVQSEVYHREAAAESTYQIEIGDLSISRLEDVVSRWRVDDISNGKVALASDSDHHGGQSFVKLEPEQARNLGRALIRAGDFAECQR